MSDFLKSSLGGSSSTSPDIMAARKDALKNQVRSEFALSSAQQLINKINEKCFDKCVTKPSTSLSGSEETCLSRCLDRYMEAFNLVSRTYVGRLSREREEQTRS